MRPFQLSLAIVATITTFALGQSYSLPDVITLFQNTSALADLTAFLNQNLDVTTQYEHLTNITIFAASNEAFLAFETTPSTFNHPTDLTILEAILEYHIVVGQIESVTETAFVQSFLAPDQFTNRTGGQYVGLIPTSGGNFSLLSGFGAQTSIIAGPLHFQNGIVYVIDKVMTVPMDITTTMRQMNLTSTSGALNETQLALPMDSTWDMTVFAPENAAFDAIGSALNNMTINDLTHLMQYHMLAGNVVYSSNFGNKHLHSVQGENITMRQYSDGSVFVNNARIIKKDILLQNGVLHIIDNVMNPNNTTVVPTTTASGLVAFAGATSNGIVPFTNVPYPTAVSAPTTLNSTAPGASASPSSGAAPRSSISHGAIAAVVLGVLVGVGVVLSGIYLFFRSKGYKVKVSRMSIIISPPRVTYELPEHGGHTDKFELPGSEKTSDRSESPDPTEFLDDKRTKPSKSDPSPISPLSPHDGIWELSAETDVRQRIEKLLKPKDQI